MIFLFWPWHIGVFSPFTSPNPHKDIPFFPLDISIQTPPPSGLLLMWTLFTYLYIYLLFQPRRVFFHKALLGCTARWAFPPARLLTSRMPISTVVKTQALCTPPAKCWIRRIMATSDFHHRSVVYHPWSKSPLTQFVHVHCKTGCQTMVDRGGESRLASEGEQYMDSFKGLVNNT